MASIIVVSGTQKGDYYPLGQRTNVIGRDEALPIQILEHRLVFPQVRIPAPNRTESGLLRLMV